MADTSRPSSNVTGAWRAPDAAAPAPGGAIWYVLGFLLLLALAQAFFFQIQGGETISYSEFKALVREDKVQEVTLSDDGIRGMLKAADNAKSRSRSAPVRVEDAKLPEELEAHGVKYTGEVASRWVTEVIGWIIPLLFIVGAVDLLLPPHGRRRRRRDVVRAQQARRSTPTTTSR